MSFLRRSLQRFFNIRMLYFSMQKAQGLPMTTIVLIIIVLIVLVVVALFFFTSFGRGSGSVNVFQCQQQCSTINTLITAGQICSTSVSSNDNFKRFCAGGCASAIKCQLTTRSNNCGWNLATYSNPACITCPTTVASIGGC